MLLINLPVTFPEQTHAVMAFCPGNEVLTNKQAALIFSLPRDSNKEKTDWINLLMFPGVQRFHF